MRGDAALSLAPVSLNDLSEVETLFGDLGPYSLHVDGVSRREGAAYAFVTARPPGCRPDEKHAFLVRREGSPVGLLDLIDGYPSAGTAFIGLLAVRASAQGSGLGRALAREAERFARDELTATTLRLAVVETNPVFGFWEKMGFRPTGEVKPYNGEAVTSHAVLMEKTIVAPVSTAAPVVG